MTISISYKKLWVHLVEREMKKTDLLSAANISASTLAKLGKNEPVKLEVLVRICEALELNIGDIVDFIPKENKS